MLRLDHGLYSHPNKFCGGGGLGGGGGWRWREGVRTQVNFKGNSPLPEKKLSSEIKESKIDVISALSEVSVQLFLGYTVLCTSNAVNIFNLSLHAGDSVQHFGLIVKDPKLYFPVCYLNMSGDFPSW